MPELTCPWCGQPSEPADARFIAESRALRGDPVLGAEHMLRFRPGRFRAGGQPIDPGGEVATRPACGACRHEWPASMWTASRRGMVQVPDASNAAELLVSARKRLAQMGWTLEDISAAGLTNSLSPSREHPRIATLECRSAEQCDLLFVAVDSPGARPTVMVTDSMPSQVEADLHIVLQPASITHRSLISTTGSARLDQFERSPDWPANCFAAPRSDDTWSAVVLLSLGCVHGADHV